MPELPEQLLNSLEALPHFNRQAFTEAHKAENRITSVRLNPFKETVLKLDKSGEVPWAGRAWYLNERPSFTLDPLFHAGCYYVQEPGSMFLEHALKSVGGDMSGLTVLDLCAAPGGKSTHLNSIVGEAGLLVSNEFVKGRVPSLVHNLSKWGTNNTVVTNSEPGKFGALGPCFDVMVVDAPCSGSGLFRKQPEAVEEWSESNVLMCSRRQRQILGEALPALKEEGLLFYSTCSYSVEENEEVVKWLCDEMGMEFMPIPLEKTWGIVETGLGYRFYPDKTASEGFFCAILRKTGDQGGRGRGQKAFPEQPDKAEKALISGFLDLQTGLLSKLQGRLHFLSEKCLQFVHEKGNKLYLKKAGQFVGEIKGKDLVPSHELALSNQLLATVERVELDELQSLAFLRKSAFPGHDEVRGLQLITHQGMGLGWAKFMPGRMNNYLPNELRILM